MTCVACCQVVSGESALRAWVSKFEVKGVFDVASTRRRIDDHECTTARILLKAWVEPGAHICGEEGEVGLAHDEDKGRSPLS